MATKTGGGYIWAVSGMETIQSLDSDRRDEISRRGQGECAKRLLKAMVRNMRCDGRRVGDYKALGVMHRNKGMVRSGKGERKYGKSM